MSKGSTAVANWQRAMIVLTGTVVGVGVISCLYWAQPIFIPVVLAIYFTFLLSPLINGLQRLGIARVPAVLVIILLVGLTLIGMSWVVSHEVSALAKQLPEYSDNIREKIRSLKTSTEGSPWGKFAYLIQDISEQIKVAPGSPEMTTTSQLPSDETGGVNVSLPKKPTIMAVKSESPSLPSWLPSLARSLVDTVATIVLTVVLVGFMMLKREDLRNRLLWLATGGSMSPPKHSMKQATA